MIDEASQKNELHATQGPGSDQIWYLQLEVPEIMSELCLLT